MLVLMIGLGLFLGCHGLAMFPSARARLVDAWGRPLYRLVFSLLSLAGLALIIFGFAIYRATGWVQLWVPPPATRHMAMLLMLPVFVLLLSVYLPGKIKSTIRHPMFVAVILWALAHLLANGDLGGVVIFGSFLLWGVCALISVNFRDMPATAKRGFGRHDVMALAGGALLYACFVVFLHPWLIGVRLLP